MSADVHKIAVAGASGRMGRTLLEAIRAAEDCQIAGALDVPGSPALGVDVAAFLGHLANVPITADVRQGLGEK